jgi:hypothetical protein
VVILESMMNEYKRSHVKDDEAYELASNVSYELGMKPGSEKVPRSGPTVL